MQFEKLVFFTGFGCQKLQQLFAIILAYLFTPLAFVILIFSYIYHCLIKIILRIQFKDRFIGFLKGTDCLWANEEAVHFAVINILLIIVKTEQNSNVIILESLRNLIHDRIISKITGTIFEKLFYRRRQKFGYYFWERNEEIDLNNRIRWLECENADCDGSCEDVSSEFFKKNLGSICNKALPDDHTASWEILVGKRCSRGRSRVDGHSASEECFDTDTCKIPVIIRYHHSMCDGISFLKFFFGTIFDKEKDKTKVKIENISINANETNFKELVSPLRNSEKDLTNETRNLNEKIVRSYKKNIFATFTSFTTLSRVLKNLRGHFLVLLKYSKIITIDSLKRQAKISINHRLNFKDCLKQVYEKIKEIMHLTMCILLIPKYVIKHNCNIDKNSLHGPSQTGEKIISYYLDDAIDKSQKLFMKVCEIKKRTNVRFEDVVLTAFSISIHKYHLRINRPAPDSLTVVIPIRIIMPDEYKTLDNNFSISRLRICISKNGQKSEPNKDFQFFKRLQDITKANNECRKSSEILINFWMIKHVFAILPAKILKLFVLSPSTLMFSNVCGSEKFYTLNNYLASNLTFWLPNKGTTALGLSVISYGGNLNISLIADKSIINDEKALNEILEDIVREINHAYKSMM